jgi:hypothetical protein
VAGNDNKKSGFFYVEGNEVKNGWNHEGSGTSSKGTHILSGSGLTSDGVSAGKPIFAYEVVAADNNPYIYAATRRDANTEIINGPLGTNPLHAFVTPTSGYFENPYLAQDNTSKDLFIVDKAGVRKLPADQIGKAGEVEVIEIKARTDKVGSNLWKMDASITMGVSTGADNNKVTDVVIHDGKLYIGLKSVGVDTGGVAVYDIAADNTIRPSKDAWNKVDVLNLTVGDSKVWAVTKVGIVEVKEDGTKGDALAKAADDEGDDLPVANITSARFVGDKGLIFTTADQGILYRATVTR